MRTQIGAEPCDLPVDAAARQLPADGIEDDHVPGADVIAVVGTKRILRARAEGGQAVREVVEVARCVRRLVLVVADRRFVRDFTCPQVGW